MQPTIMRPFSDKIFGILQEHVRAVRARHSGDPFPDADEPPDRRFYRWYEHNNPLLTKLLHRPDLIVKISEAFGEPVMPSYVFLSMYSNQGVCRLHRDRPQCRYTVDLCINQDKPWPLYIESSADTFDEVILQEGEAVLYSGTRLLHYRKPMLENGGTFCDLALFHMVPIGFQGKLS